MRENEIVKVALDIGNHSIKLLMGKMNSTCDKISIVDYVKVRSKGFRKSKIENPEELMSSIKEALDILERKIGTNIEKVSLSIGGAGTTSATKAIKITFPEKEVTQEDMDNLLNQAKKRIFGPKIGYYRILYKEIYNIRVNSAGIVKTAIGMQAKELQADVHLVYVEEDYAEKFIEIINRLGIEVEELYLNSYVSSKGTLDEESRKMGVAHVDIGYASTDIILLKSGKVLYTKTIPLGEMHYVSDMSHMLGLSREDAEEVLEKFKKKEIENDNTIRYGAKKVSLRDIRDIIQARTTDIIAFINSTIENSGFNGYLAKGIVLTGGAVEIEGLAEQITKSRGLVRKEKPMGLKNMRNPFYGDAVVIGIFFEDMEKEYRIFIQDKKNKKEKIQQIEDEQAEEETVDDLDEVLEQSNTEKKGILQWLKKWL